MSGVYIAGMEMPKSCWSCPFSVHQDPDTDRCLATGTLYETTWARFNNRLPACPLIPVPEHGRLGDLDALEAKCTDEKGSYFSYEAAIIGEAVSSALTIIPADNPENKKPTLRDQGGPVIQKDHEDNTHCTKISAGCQGGDG